MCPWGWTGALSHSPAKDLGIRELEDIQQPWTVKWVLPEYRRLSQALNHRSVRATMVFFVLVIRLYVPCHFLLCFPTPSPGSPKGGFKSTRDQQHHNWHPQKIQGTGRNQKHCTHRDSLHIKIWP
ncbi:hypothetical protein FKM82_005163 [Ascaphus truei]